MKTLQGLRAAFDESPDLTRFFIHPSIPEDRKQALVSQMCDQFSAGDPVRKMLATLVSRKKITFVKNIAEYFEGFVDQRLGQVRVSVVSAIPMESAHLDKLKTSLDRILGKKALIDSSVDETLLGGVRLSVGSMVADASVKNRLAQLRHALEQEEVFSELASG